MSFTPEQLEAAANAINVNRNIMTGPYALNPEMHAALFLAKCAEDALRAMAQEMENETSRREDTAWERDMGR